MSFRKSGTYQGRCLHFQCWIGILQGPESLDAGRNAHHDGCQPDISHLCDSVGSESDAEDWRQGWTHSLCQQVKKPLKILDSMSLTDRCFSTAAHFNFDSTAIGFYSATKQALKCLMEFWRKEVSSLIRSLIRHHFSSFF